VPQKIKEQRLREVMLTQQEIVLKKHENLVGNSISVIVDEKNESNDGWIGRTYGDAPDVDSKVIIEGNHVKAGDIKNMRITGTAGYDLTAISMKNGKRIK
jgi:ribosomal protein S12 methylthiotransferase